jgi:hypothetical protein
MGLTCSSSASETSCSSFIATFKNENCMSSCMKTEEQALAVLTPIIEVLAKKYIEEHMHVIITDRLPAALAAHMNSVVDEVVEDVMPNISPNPIIDYHAVDLGLSPPPSASRPTLVRSLTTGHYP